MRTCDQIDNWTTYTPPASKSQVHPNSWQHGGSGYSGASQDGYRVTEVDSSTQKHSYRMGNYVVAGPEDDMEGPHGGWNDDNREVDLSGMKILRRTGESCTSGTSSNNSNKMKQQSGAGQDARSLQEREKEYEEARRRIFGNHA